MHKLSPPKGRREREREREGFEKVSLKHISKPWRRRHSKLCYWIGLGEISNVRNDTLKFNSINLKNFLIITCKKKLWWCNASIFFNLMNTPNSSLALVCVVLLVMTLNKREVDVTIIFLSSYIFLNLWIFLENMRFSTYSSAICPLLLISLKSSCWYFSWKLSLSWKSSFCHYALSSISQHISHEDSHSSYISSCPTWVRASPHYLTIIAIMLLLHFTNPTPTMRFSSNPLW